MNIGLETLLKSFQKQGICCDLTLPYIEAQPNHWEWHVRISYCINYDSDVWNEIIWKLDKPLAAQDTETICVAYNIIERLEDND